MKKILVALALAAFATTASAAIAGTVHDLSIGGTLSSCQYCHAPHWSNNTFTGAPLWNRNVDGTGFTFYSTPGVPAPAQLNAASLTCLSCHDGRQSVGNVYAGTDDTTKAAIPDTSPGGANLGLLLTNDHPVSITYPAGGAGTGFVANATVRTNLRLYDYGVGNNDNVECASCHEPHDNSNTMFLRVAATAICAACHTK